MTSKNIEPPALIKLEDFNGDVKAYIEHLYSIFRKDFLNSQPVLFNKNVTIGRQKRVDGKELAFWHITSKGGKDHVDRLPDLRRCEKLHWIRFSIENIENIEGLLYWEKNEKYETRLYIFLKSNAFLVVLKKTNTCYFFVTAFHVNYPRKRKWLLRQYKEAQTKSAQ